MWDAPAIPNARSAASLRRLASASVPSVKASKGNVNVAGRRKYGIRHARQASRCHIMLPSRVWRSSATSATRQLSGS